MAATAQVPYRTPPSALSSCRARHPRHPLHVAVGRVAKLHGVLPLDGALCVPRRGGGLQDLLLQGRVRVFGTAQPVVHRLRHDFVIVRVLLPVVVANPGLLGLDLVFPPLLDEENLLPILRFPLEAALLLAMTA